jgi:hypothetical protein
LNIPPDFIALDPKCKSLITITRVLFPFDVACCATVADAVVIGGVGVASVVVVVGAKDVGAADEGESDDACKILAELNIFFLPRARLASTFFDMKTISNINNESLTTRNMNFCRKNRTEKLYSWHLMLSRFSIDFRISRKQQ